VVEMDKIKKFTQNLDDEFFWKVTT